MYKHARSLVCLTIAAVFCAASASQSLSAETYWVAKHKKEGTKQTVDYSVQVPEFFVPYLKLQTPRKGGMEVKKKINGKEYTFVKQYLSWDVDKQNPDHGVIRIDEAPLRYQSHLHFMHVDPSDYTEQFKDALTALAKPAEGNPTWKEVDLLALKFNGQGPPNLSYTEVPTVLGDVAAAKELLRTFAVDTEGGHYFAAEGIQVPVKLDEFRTQVLLIGNLARRDPNYRKTHQYWGDNGTKEGGLVSPKDATDLSGTEVIDFNEETKKNERLKLHKQHQSPPYFDDLVLNAKLNEAAQFHAEYQATTAQAGHYGPQEYLGNSPKVKAIFVKKAATMYAIKDRVNHFGYEAGIDMEGAGGSQFHAPDWAPEWWITSDTHFRPWFNAGNAVTEIGFGVARDKSVKDPNGGWYFCVLMGLGK